MMLLVVTCVSPFGIFWLMFFVRYLPNYSYYVESCFSFRLPNLFVIGLSSGVLYKSLKHFSSDACLFLLLDSFLTELRVLGFWFFSWCFFALPFSRISYAFRIITNQNSLELRDYDFFSSLQVFISLPSCQLFFIIKSSYWNLHFTWFTSYFCYPLFFYLSFFILHNVYFFISTIRTMIYCNFLHLILL